MMIFKRMFGAVLGIFSMKLVAFIVIGLLASTTFAGYLAKQQYDKALVAEQYVTSLESMLAAKAAAEILAVELIQRKNKREKELANELSKQTAALKSVPTDGCLDRAVPGAVLDGLR